MVQQESQRQIEELQKENEELRQAKGTAPKDKDAEFIEAELRAALGQAARLQNDLADANVKLLQIEKGGASPQSPEQAQVIASIAQDLRQPMSSVVGYTDLLLGESVGILGSLQRKFVERIKASTERIGTLIDDMIQVTNLETGLTELNPEPADLNGIIDNAMSYTSSQVRDKNITLHLDLPKKIQSIYADPEALQQILIHLLQNAGAVSPLEGTISLKVQTRSEEDQEYVLLQVTDTGGGILSEDIPRVFTRLYRADNVLIQGVGDTGVGLSIAKALTEAQNGRIWVDKRSRCRLYIQRAAAHAQRGVGHGYAAPVGGQPDLSALFRCHGHRGHVPGAGRKLRSGRPDTYRNAGIYPVCRIANHRTTPGHTRNRHSTSHSNCDHPAAYHMPAAPRLGADFRGARR